MMKTTQRLGGLFLAGLIAGQPALADRLDDILQRGSVRVGTTGDYRPFSERDAASGAYRGLDIEMAESLARALGVKLELVATSWPTLMRDHEAGKFDIAMSGVSINLERQKRALYSQPYLNDGKTPITRCENVQRFQTIAQINQPRVKLIVNPGGTNESSRAPPAGGHADRASGQRHHFPADHRRQGRSDGDRRGGNPLSAETASGAVRGAPGEAVRLFAKAYLLPNDWRWKAWVDQWLSQSLQNGEFVGLSAKWLGN